MSRSSPWMFYDQSVQVAQAVRRVPNGGVRDRRARGDGGPHRHVGVVDRFELAIRSTRQKVDTLHTVLWRPNEPLVVGHAHHNGCVVESIGDALGVGTAGAERAQIDQRRAVARVVETVVGIGGADVGIARHLPARIDCRRSTVWKLAGEHADIRYGVLLISGGGVHLRSRHARERRRQENQDQDFENPSHAATNCSAARRALRPRRLSMPLKLL